MTGGRDARRCFPMPLSSSACPLPDRALCNKVPKGDQNSAQVPLRQTAGMVASLLGLAGLDWPVPDFSTLCRRQKTLAVQIPYRRADGPLNLLVPSRDITA